MDEFIFPFSELSDFNRLFSDEILPYDYFSSLNSLCSEFPSNTNHNNNDEIDLEILNNNNIPCSYFDVNSFGNFSGLDKISLLSLNINSLPKNFDNFVATLMNGSYVPKIIGFCETKLNSNIEQLYSIPGYTNVFNSNTTRSGGLALYINSNIKFRLIDELCVIHSYIESLCIEIQFENECYFVCLIYRRPGSDFDQFMLSYNHIICNTRRKNCLIFGDFNLDLLRYETSNIVESFVHSNFENSFYSVVNKPTRVTSHSATVIDHIWCNFVNNSFVSGVLLTEFSDHFAPFMRIMVDTEVREPNGLSYYRDWSKLEDGNFISRLLVEMQKFNFSVIYDVDISLNNLLHTIADTIDAICPMKCLNFEYDKIEPKPWITIPIRQLIKVRNKLYSKYCKKPITYGDSYRSCRNRLNNMIRNSKKNYYQNILKINRSDCRKTWKIINNLLNRNPQQDRFKQIFDGVQLTSNAEEISGVFNNHFINTPINIANSLVSDSNLNFRNFLSGNYPQSMFIRPLTPSNLINITKSLKNTSSGGYLDLPSKVIKFIIEDISVPLSIIFNKCINDGYFPDKLKVAQVIPIYKAGDPTRPNNFRPISILTIFSKIFEKHIYNELLIYIEQNNVINDQQCGFRKGVSTNIAIAKFIKEVICGLNENKYGIGIFLDLQKAFDMVNHDILLCKLNHYGIRGIPYNLIKSFLSNRLQYVKLNSTKSEIAKSSLGTPQGSILSPLLFIIFINDIVNCSSILHFNLFADDTCIYMKNSDLELLYQNFNSELINVQNWISANSLSLNVGKTVYLLFSGRKKVLKETPTLKLFSKKIERKPETKFLGLLIDDKLTWKPHAHYVSGKIYRVVGILSKLLNCFNLDALRTIYFSLIYPHLQYGIIFWGSVCQSEFLKIFRAQKKCIRILAKSGHYDHSEPLFKSLNVLKVNDIRYLEMAKFVFIDKTGKNCFDFQTREAIHSYSTRNNTDLILPQPRTNILRNSIFYEGLRFFNDLPTDMKSAHDVFKFKNSLKFHLLSLYNHS